MKKFLSITLLLSTIVIFSQTITKNTHAVGLEHNMLFNATSRYTVTQTGNATLNLSYLFDGKFQPSYTSNAPSISSPTVVTIEGLPNYHVQTGAWVGWSTRYWHAKRFKIEAYNMWASTYTTANTWVTVADYTDKDYTEGTSFSIKLPSGSYTKLRFTFYSTYGSNGRLGVSELFYLHPEATSPYQGLTTSFQSLNIHNKKPFDTNDVDENQDHITFSSDDPGNGNYFGGLTWKSGGRRRAAIAATREHSDADFVGLSFLTQGTDGPGPFKESMRITRNGEVGIGTSTPVSGYKLTVQGNVNVGGTTNSRLRVRHVDGKAPTSTSYDNLYLNYSNGKDVYVGGSSSVSGTDLFIPKGDVGIGTNSTTSKLDLRSVERKAFRIYKENATDKYLSFWHGTVGAVIEPIRTNGSTSQMFLGGYDNPTDVYLSNKEGGTVGIGTTNTKGFKLGVNGKIAATEVKVATYTNWADFVFYKDYKLPTLEEVENYIQEKGHLENIPSAEEVKKDGFFLGEMDAKLLQKIEELTLYTIQQEKRIKELEEKNSQLVKEGERINELEKKLNQLLDSKK